jgi:hypothetical protein
MTCRGYDPKSVKVPKSVKRLAACYLDPHVRRSVIKSYVEVYEADMRARGASRNKK